MMELVYGLKGDGKTLTAATIILHWLRTSRFYVCTNVPFVSLNAVAEYLDGKTPGGIDVQGRMRILNDREVLRFWRHLGPGLDFMENIKIKLPCKTAEYREIEVPDYSRLTNDWPGCLVVIDECHIPFSAYNYADISDEMTWAVSQDRKIGIEAVLVSQSPEKVAKALRRDIHKFTRVRNYGNQRTFGFVLPGRFRRMTYPELPTRGDSEQIVEEASWFTLDMDIAKLYHTNAGVGITARTFNVERRAKGWRLWNLAWMVPLAVVLCFGLAWGAGSIMSGIPKLMYRFGAGASGAVGSVAKSTVAKSVPAMGGAVSGAPVVHQSLSSNEAGQGVSSNVKTNQSEPLFWTARWMLNGRWCLSLTDGRTLGLGPEFTGFSGDICYVGGRAVLPWRGGNKREFVQSGNLK